MSGKITLQSLTTSKHFTTLPSRHHPALSESPTKNASSADKTCIVGLGSLSAASTKAIANVLWPTTDKIQIKLIFVPWDAKLTDLVGPHYIFVSISFFKIALKIYG